MLTTLYYLLYKLKPHSINMKYGTLPSTDQENFNTSNPTPRLDKSFDRTAAVAISITVVIVLLAIIGGCVLFLLQEKESQRHWHDSVRKIHQTYIHLETFLYSNRNPNIDTNLENQYYFGEIYIITYY